MKLTLVYFGVLNALLAAADDSSSSSTVDTSGATSPLLDLQRRQSLPLIGSLPLLGSLTGGLQRRQSLPLIGSLPLLGSLTGGLQPPSPDDSASDTDAAPAADTDAALAPDSTPADKDESAPKRNHPNKSKKGKKGKNSKPQHAKAPKPAPVVSSNRFTPALDDLPPIPATLIPLTRRQLPVLPQAAAPQAAAPQSSVPQLPGPLGQLQSLGASSMQQAGSADPLKAATGGLLRRQLPQASAPQLPGPLGQLQSLGASSMQQPNNTDALKNAAAPLSILTGAVPLAKRATDPSVEGSHAVQEPNPFDSTIECMQEMAVHAHRFARRATQAAVDTLRSYSKRQDDLRKRQVDSLSTSGSLSKPLQGLLGSSGGSSSGSTIPLGSGGGSALPLGGGSPLGGLLRRRLEPITSLVKRMPMAGSILKKRQLSTLPGDLDELPLTSSGPILAGPKKGLEGALTGLSPPPAADADKRDLSPLQSMTQLMKRQVLSHAPGMTDEQQREVFNSVAQIFLPAMKSASDTPKRDLSERADFSELAEAADLFMRSLIAYAPSQATKLHQVRNEINEATELH